MARIDKKKQKRKQRELLRKQKEKWDGNDRSQSFEYYNGGGCEPFNIKCEGCGLIQPGGEQFHVPGLQITPCFTCGSLVALYEPQLL